jgi:MoaA/NifB/PqqE/SkfB family radical SAM enzyme
VKKLGELLKKRYDSLKITGGEPAIYPGISKIIRFARQKGLDKIMLISNGRMFSLGKFCKEIENAGLTNVRITVYSDEEAVHDKITQTKGSFRQTMKGIDNVLSSRMALECNVVIIRYNYKNLKQICLFLVKKGVKKINLLFATPPDDDKKWVSVIPKFSEAAYYIHEALCIPNVLISYRHIPLCFMEGFEGQSSNLYSEGTRVSDSRLTIEDSEELFKTKIKKCSSCPKKDSCEGVWKNYIKIYGEGEFA